MKIQVLIAVVLFPCALFSQELLKNVGNAAKSKLESQDFNSSRSNRDKSNLRNEKPNSEAVPAPAPGSAVPPDTSATKPVAAANTVTTGNRTYQAIYTFDKVMTYEMMDPKKPEKPAELVTYSYSDGAVMTHMSANEKMMVLTDFANEVAITFDEKNQSAMIMSTRWATNMAQNFASDKEVTITKTGEKKEILGYNCEEYLITDKKGKTSCFITSDIKMNYARTIEALTKNKVGTGGAADFPAESLMMEMTSYNKKGEAESHMIMKSFKEEKTSKTVTDYKVTAL